MDLGSTHGTYISGRRLEGNKPYRLSDGEDVTFGCKVTNGPRKLESPEARVSADRLPDTHLPKTFRVSYGYDSSAIPQAIINSQTYSVPDDSDSEPSEYECGPREPSVELLDSKPRSYSVPSSDDEDSYESEEEDDISEGKKDDTSAATTPESKGKGKNDIRNLLNQDQDAQPGSSGRPISLDDSTSKPTQHQFHNTRVEDFVEETDDDEDEDAFEPEAALIEKPPTPPARPHRPFSGIAESKEATPTSVRFIPETQINSDIGNLERHIEKIDASKVATVTELCNGSSQATGLLVEPRAQKANREPSPSDAAMMQSRRLQANGPSNVTQQTADFYAQPPTHFPFSYSYEPPAPYVSYNPAVPPHYVSSFRQACGYPSLNESSWGDAPDAYDIGTSVASNFGSTKTSEAAPFEQEHDTHRAGPSIADLLPSDIQSAARQHGEQHQSSRLSIPELCNRIQESEAENPLKRKADTMSAIREGIRSHLNNGWNTPSSRSSSPLFPKSPSPELRNQISIPESPDFMASLSPLAGAARLTSEPMMVPPAFVEPEATDWRASKREVPETPQEDDDRILPPPVPEELQEVERPTKRIKTASASSGSRIAGVGKFLAGAAIGAAGVVAALIATTPADVAAELASEWV